MTVVVLCCLVSSFENADRFICYPCFIHFVIQEAEDAKELGAMDFLSSIQVVIVVLVVLEVLVVFVVLVVIDDSNCRCGDPLIILLRYNTSEAIKYN